MIYLRTPNVINILKQVLKEYLYEINEFSSSLRPQTVLKNHKKKLE